MAFHTKRASGETANEQPTTNPTETHTTRAAAAALADPVHNGMRWVFPPTGLSPSTRATVAMVSTPIPRACTLSNRMTELHRRYPN